jgi:hypothetical protein
LFPLNQRKTKEPPAKLNQRADEALLLQAALKFVGLGKKGAPTIARLVRPDNRPDGLQLRT